MTRNISTNEGEKVSPSDENWDEIFINPERTTQQIRRLESIHGIIPNTRTARLTDRVLTPTRQPPSPPSPLPHRPSPIYPHRYTCTRAKYRFDPSIEPATYKTRRFNQLRNKRRANIDESIPPSFPQLSLPFSPVPSPQFLLASSFFPYLSPFSILILLQRYTVVCLELFLSPLSRAPSSTYPCCQNPSYSLPPAVSSSFLLSVTHQSNESRLE